MDYFTTSILAYKLRLFSRNSGLNDPNAGATEANIRVNFDPRWQIPRAGRSLILLTERGYNSSATIPDFKSGIRRKTLKTEIWFRFVC